MKTYLLEMSELDLTPVYSSPCGNNYFLVGLYSSTQEQRRIKPASTKVSVNVSQLVVEFASDPGTLRVFSPSDLARWILRDWRALGFRYVILPAYGVGSVVPKTGVPLQKERFVFLDQPQSSSLEYAAFLLANQVMNGWAIETPVVHDVCTGGAR